MQPGQSRASAAGLGSWLGSVAVNVLQSRTTVPVDHSRVNVPEPGAVSAQNDDVPPPVGPPVGPVGWPKSRSISAGRGTPCGRGGSSPCAGSGLNGHPIPHVPHPSHAKGPRVRRKNATSCSRWAKEVAFTRVIPTRCACVCHVLFAQPLHAARSCDAQVVGASAVVAGEITQAVRESTSDAGPITTGDWLGICRDGIVAVQPTMSSAATALLASILDDDHELLTVIAGEDADNGVTDEIEAWLGEHHPEVEVEVHQGGQPLYPYYFGLE